MSFYERVADFSPGVDQRASARAARIRASIHWGEADLAAGRYRKAVERADRAISIAGGAGRPDAADALALREEALARGTVRVAVAPIWCSNETAETLPEAFLQALNDELELAHWSEPPLFVAVADPVLVRQRMRQAGYLRSRMGVWEASAVGRSVDANLVVTGEILEFAVTEEDVQRAYHSAQTVDDVDTTYLVRRGKRRYRLRAAYTVVDAERSSGQAKRSFEVFELHSFRRADYHRDYNELKLSRSQRQLFDPQREQEEREEVERHLIQKASRQFADRVYGEVLSHVH
ncbi:MAG: hypothetical protein ACE5G2_10930 [Candidatus Krumholzibacteriia bacterium]